LSDIFIIILNKKQTTRREIEYETGFSWGTVSSNIAFLLEKGYIVEEKSEQSGNVGRSTYTLKPASEGIVSIGLDINRSGLSCEVVGLDSAVKNTFTADFSATTQNEVIREAENICQRAIEWCKNNGILYTGHVLEDNNLHTKYGNGPGHYFRSQQGQTMPGFDIVLHQLLPDHADSDYNGSANWRNHISATHTNLAG
jgi:hypothetical protein